MQIFISLLALAGMSLSLVACGQQDKVTAVTGAQMQSDQDQKQVVQQEVKMEQRSAESSDNISSKPDQVVKVDSQVVNAPLAVRSKAIKEIVLEPMPEHTLLSHGGPVIRNTEVYMRTGSVAQSGPWVTGVGLNLKKGHYHVDYKLAGEALNPEQIAASLIVQWQVSPDSSPVTLSSRTLFSEELSVSSNNFGLDFTIPRDGKVVLGVHYAGQGILKLYQRVLSILDSTGDLSQTAAQIGKVQIQLESPKGNSAEESENAVSIS